MIIPFYRAPAVVFIDDIDIMCPRRERSQSDLEKRVLASLVSEIDKLVQVIHLVIVKLTHIHLGMCR